MELNDESETLTTCTATDLMTESDKTQSKIWWSIGIVGFISLFFAFAFNQATYKNRTFDEKSPYGKKAECIQSIRRSGKGIKIEYESRELQKTGEGLISVSGKNAFGVRVTQNLYCRGGYAYDEEK